MCLEEHDVLLGATGGGHAVGTERMTFGWRAFFCKALKNRTYVGMLAFCAFLASFGKYNL